MLIDLTRGASAVSGPLGLPRAPGFTDLAAGRAGFDDVIRVDTDTPLQVIAAGNPAVKPKGEEIDRFMRVFEALTEAYDCVVLHADRDTVKKLTPALKFELPVTVVVLPHRAARPQILATSPRLAVRSWFTSKPGRKAAAVCSAGSLQSERLTLAQAAAEQILPQPLRQGPDMPVRFDRPLEAAPWRQAAGSAAIPAASAR